METLNDFELKQRKYMPVFPKANGKPTVYIQGYPYEDEEPMPATGRHGEQQSVFYEQLSRYFRGNAHIYVGLDNFIYYREGDSTKVVAPDVYVVFGVAKYPLRRSFYTWSEGAVPVAVFEFLSDTTASQDRSEKVAVYLSEMGVVEYFVHQPDMEESFEFRGWCRAERGTIVEMVPDSEGGLFSETLNLYFRSEAQPESYVRLLRPYLLDGTPITTSMEEHDLRMEEHDLRVAAEGIAAEAERRATAEAEHRREAEGIAAEAERRATAEAEHRREAEGIAAEAERRATAEAEHRREVEAELEHLRAQLANTPK